MRTCSRNTTQPWECKNKPESWGEGVFVLSWLSRELPTCLLSHTSWSAVPWKAGAGSGREKPWYKASCWEQQRHVPHRSTGKRAGEGSNRPFFLRGSRTAPRQRAELTAFPNSCVPSCLHSPEETRGGKSPFKVKTSPFLRVNFSLHQAAVWAVGCPRASPGKMLHGEHTAKHTPQHSWDTSGTG